MAQRYLRSKSSSNAINIITRIAGAGVFVASAALFVVLSGFTGLKDFSLQFTSFVDPDLKVFPSSGKQFEPTDLQLSKLYDVQGIQNISAVIEERMVVIYNDKKSIVTFKGVDENYSRTTVDSILTLGQWIKPGSNQMVLGWGVARDLSFSLNDYTTPIELYAPKGGKGQISSIRSALKKTIGNGVGVFQINEDFDNGYIFGDIHTAQYLIDKNDRTISAIELILNPEADPSKISNDILKVFNNEVIVKSRFQLNDALYKMLNTEQLAVYLIFTLVLIIAVFNVIGAIIMIILDKKKNLKTLYSLGVTTSDIRRIFFIHGSLMSLLSGGMGLIMGIALVVLQKEFEWAMLTTSLPYPVRMTFINVVVVIATMSILGICAAFVASRRINQKFITS